MALLAPYENIHLILLPVSDINISTLRDADVLICRSVLPVNQALLDNTHVRVVATASSGTDHIDARYLASRGIALFSAPGSNAQGVADYVLWMLAYLAKSGRIIKTAGIIGVGHVGRKVQGILDTLGLSVLLYDPPRALIEPDFISATLDEIAQQDVICVHASLSRDGRYPSEHLLSSDWLHKLKKNAILINAARGAILDTQAVLDLKDRDDICIIADVFEHEPQIHPDFVRRCLMTTPHIAGHTVESFARATQMIVDQILGYFYMIKIPPAPSFYKGGNAYEKILQCYDFQSMPPEISPPLSAENFYALRQYHGRRHDFSWTSAVINDVAKALEEDIGTGDITGALIPVSQQASAKIITRDPMILCGVAWANAAFEQVNHLYKNSQKITLHWHYNDGDIVAENTILCEITGSARTMLTAERTALNFMQTLSATATQTAEYISQLQGLKTILLDTRKTIPSLRQAQKYAVRCGGGQNHRFGLYDAFLIKENHIAACGSITQAIQRARAQAPDKKLEIEVETLLALQEAIAAAPDIIMLDNFDLQQIQAAITMRADMHASNTIKLEVSGNITGNNIHQIAETGVDFISIGAITKHIHAIDLTLLFDA